MKLDYKFQSFIGISIFILLMALVLYFISNEKAKITHLTIAVVYTNGQKDTIKADMNGLQTAPILRNTGSLSVNGWVVAYGVRKFEVIKSEQ